MDLAKLNSPECTIYKEFNLDAINQIDANFNTRQAFKAPWLLKCCVDLHNELLRMAESTVLPGRPADLRSASRVVSVVSISGDNVQGNAC